MQHANSKDTDLSHQRPTCPQGKFLNTHLTCDYVMSDETIPVETIHNFGETDSNKGEINGKFSASSNVF